MRARQQRSVHVQPRRRAQRRRGGADVVVEEDVRAWARAWRALQRVQKQVPNRRSDLRTETAPRWRAFGSDVDGGCPCMPLALVQDSALAHFSLTL